MKTWLITYLFIVCNICLHTGVLANPAKTNRTPAGIKSSYTTAPSRIFAFKKASLAITDYQSHNSGDIFFQYGSTQVLYPVVSYFTTHINFFFTISNHIPGRAISEKEVERVLKDHLLHLFPSHYFW